MTSVELQKLSNDRKPNKQCREAVKEANNILGIISRTFKFKSKVCPHLEHSLNWLSHFKKFRMETTIASDQDDAWTKKQIL